MKHWLGILTACLLIALPNMVRAGAIERIVVVKSSDNRYYDETIDTLRKHIAGAPRFEVVLLDELETTAPARQQQTLHVALGKAAVDALNAPAPGVDSINAYLTLEEFMQIDIDRRRPTVLLDQPLQRYLAFCRLLLPARNVGVISTMPLDIDGTRLELLEKSGLVLNQYRVDSQNKLMPVLREVLRYNDALLMLPHRRVYNRDTLKGVLVSGYRNRKPVISYSPAHVRAGALASIYSSPVDIGRHLATLVNRRLENLPDSGATYHFARFYTISTNPKVAAALDLELPPMAELRGQLDRLN